MAALRGSFTLFERLILQLDIDTRVVLRNVEVAAFIVLHSAVGHGACRADLVGGIIELEV